MGVLGEGRREAAAAHIGRCSVEWCGASPDAVPADALRTAAVRAVVGLVCACASRPPCGRQAVCRFYLPRQSVLAGCAAGMLEKVCAWLSLLRVMELPPPPPVATPCPVAAAVAAAADVAKLVRGSRC